MVGLTGGVASGKSTVSSYLERLGAVVLDADVLARQAIAPGTEGHRRTVQAFPEAARDNNTIDRKQLGRIVFANEEKRRILEGIIHPRVISEIKEQGRQWETSGYTVVADIPLLFETGCDQFLSPIWVVYVDEQTQQKRIMERDDIDAAQARQRMESQMPLHEKAAKADAVIDNSGSVQQTYAQVEALWRELHEDCPDCP